MPLDREWDLSNELRDFICDIPGPGFTRPNSPQVGNRSLFLQKLQEGEPEHLHTIVHLDLWYGCLFVVVEGWRREKISDPSVTQLLRKKANRALLEGYCNAVFHYHSDYVDSSRRRVLEVRNSSRG